MENKNNKIVLITIIVLLCIFAPLSIIGLLGRQNISPLEENPNHDTYYDGYMWFYDANDEFLSKYECATEICEYTNTTINDDTYGINYYKEGNIPSVSLINDKYTFITDGSVIYLYAADTGTTLQSYKEVKTYNTKLENNAYIVKNNNDVWGVIRFGDNLGAMLPFEYSFIGLTNNLNEDGTLSTDKFIVQKDTKWYLVDSNNSAITGYIDDPIIDYNEDYVFSKNQNRVRIYSYENYEYLTNYEIKDYILVDNYIGIITNNFVLLFENLGNSYIKSVALTNSDSNIEIEKVENKINIKVDGEIKESVELS